MLPKRCTVIQIQRNFDISGIGFLHQIKTFPESVLAQSRRNCTDMPGYILKTSSSEKPENPIL
jgi:hypothetical protein